MKELSRVILPDVTIEAPYVDANDNPVKVKFGNIVVCSEEFSEEEIRKLNVDEVIETHAFNIVAKSRTVAGVRLDCENGGDLQVKPKIWWRKAETTVKSCSIVPSRKIDVSPAQSWIVNRPF